MRSIVRTVVLIVGTGVAAPLHATTYYVAQNGQTQTTPYTNWTMAASNIQDAVNTVPGGAGSAQHTIWVGPGRYIVPTNAAAFSDVNTNVVLIYDKAIILRTSSTNPVDTIIDGGGAYRGFKAVCNRETTNRIVLDGFTITNCYATNSGGGGVFFDGFSHGWTGVVQNCVITHNRSTGGSEGGGGFYGKWVGGPTEAKSFNLTVYDCVIKNNSATGGSMGGGLYATTITLIGQRVRFIRCLIENNQSLHDGGGLYSNFANVENCVIRNNSAGRNGGGVFNSDACISLTNTLICNNVGAQGGAVYDNNATERSGDELELVNCTVASNSAGAYGAITLKNGSTKGQVRISNSIVYSNASVDFYNIPNMTNVFLTTSCTSSTNGFPGSGNITNNPMFADFAGQDFRLARSSPCINTGTSQAWMVGAVDLAGKRRVDQESGLVDMGCYEYVFPSGTLIMTR